MTCKFFNECNTQLTTKPRMKLDAVVFRNGEQFCVILLMKTLKEKRDFAITFS